VPVVATSTLAAAKELEKLERRYAHLKAKPKT
jgi:hypothetical protein